MDAEHAQVARIGLAATREDGFALAGGQAQQLRTRAANPDMDQAMRLTEAGQSRAGSGPAGLTQGAAGRTGKSLSQERTKGERGS
ncbi:MULTISPECIES: hypothetical protein [Kribbella]|uniref:Uncharacterized protein n=1 Tax=Kribbella pratensis TaxID=2512112 RepID=A0ABY2F9U4_9ACTN|nr:MULTISPECIES: hypothetical protein [Kribbella]TDW87365.1 hypothetical protein EV137_5439 [Kribbella pratensis]TDW91326.1 hypothetical protein EV647_4905 [Kribbella sp. VKM Ac-2566]